MDTSVLSSTFLLTLLLLVGLFFFIRASTKDRTQVVQLVSNQTEDSITQQLQQYFTQRAYQVAPASDAQNYVTFEGWVRPSYFLAIFLTGLAAVGVLCLSLVLSILFPAFSSALLSLVLVSPLAGVFYWRGAGRPEKVSLKVEPIDGEAGSKGSIITVSAHRDELAELQRALGLEAL